LGGGFGKYKECIFVFSDKDFWILEKCSEILENTYNDFGIFRKVFRDFGKYIQGFWDF
jgi:hypothetical protein